jgi:hypothetical protein
MDNLLKDSVELLELIDDRIEELKNIADIEECIGWPEIDDHFRKIQANIRLQVLKIDEVIRWD